MDIARGQQKTSIFARSFNVLDGGQRWREDVIGRHIISKVRQAFGHGTSAPPRGVGYKSVAVSVIFHEPETLLRPFYGAFAHIKHPI
jgi:hypothetical protein